MESSNIWTKKLVNTVDSMALLPINSNHITSLFFSLRCPNKLQLLFYRFLSSTSTYFVKWNLSYNPLTTPSSQRLSYLVSLFPFSLCLPTFYSFFPSAQLLLSKISAHPKSLWVLFKIFLLTPLLLHSSRLLIMFAFLTIWFLLQGRLLVFSFLWGVLWKLWPPYWYFIRNRPSESAFLRLYFARILISSHSICSFFCSYSLPRSPGFQFHHFSLFLCRTFCEGKLLGSHRR